MTCGVAVGQPAQIRGPIFATSGWFVLAVSASVEAGRHQTALRGRARCPFEKRTVAVASDASETSPCRRTGQAKRRARHPWVDGVGRRHTAGIETRVWSGRPPSCRVRLSSCALGRRAASVGRWSGLSRVLTVRSPVRGPIPNGVGSGVCRSATSEVEPQKSVAIGRGRRCCPSSACSSPGRAGGSRVGIRRRSSLLLRSGFGFVPVTPLCH
jgi:hypothetical protein